MIYAELSGLPANVGLGFRKGPRRGTPVRR